MAAPVYAIRASSFGTLLDCAHRWEGEQLLGMTKPASGAMHLGTSLHASTAAFDKGTLPGAEKVTADDAAGLFVQTLHHPEQPVVWDEPIAKAERVGLDLHNYYCKVWSPGFQWKAVEMNVGEWDISVSGVTIKLRGTLDRSRLRAGASGQGITDLKSGKRALNKLGMAVTKGHAAQVGVYELLSEKQTGEPVTEPAQIVGLMTSGTARIGVGVIHSARDMLIGKEGQPGLLEMAAMYLREGLFPPNPKSILCSEKYCARWKSCKFHE